MRLDLDTLDCCESFHLVLYLMLILDTALGAINTSDFVVLIAALISSYFLLGCLV